MTTYTWDTGGFTNGSITLSNSNKTATSGGSNGHKNTRTNAVLATDAVWGITLDNTAAAEGIVAALGISTVSNTAPLSGVGPAAGSVGYWSDTVTDSGAYSLFILDVAQFTLFSKFNAATDKLLFAWRHASKLLWCRVLYADATFSDWNNSGSANPATDTGGVDISGLGSSFYIMANMWRAGSQSTLLNTYTDLPAALMPSGYAALDGTTGGTIVALTGVSATASLGTLGKSVSKALVGVAGTSALGTLGKGVSKALTGVSATSALGTLSPAVSKALTGVAATASIGTVTPTTGGVVVALVGVSATGSLGTLGTSITASLTGVSASASLGSLGKQVSASLAGVSGTSSLGSLTAGVRIAIAGISLTTGLGTLTPSNTSEPAITLAVWTPQPLGYADYQIEG